MAALFSPFYPRNLPRSCGGLAASDGAPPDFCEQTEAFTWLHSRIMNFSQYKPIVSDLEVVCETTFGVQSHRIASHWGVRQRPSFLRQHADGLHVVRSFVHTLVQQIHARRSATKRSVGHRPHEASAVVDSEDICNGWRTVTWRPSAIGDQSGLDLDGGDVLGNDN